MSFATRTRIVLIQHLLEQTERSNTGRHAAAALSALELRVFGAKDAPLKVDDLSGAWLLWPGEAPRPPFVPGSPSPQHAATLGRADEEPLDSARGERRERRSFNQPSTLVVLDGSWSQARKMMQRIPQLHSLQRWSLPAREGRKSLRASPPGGMSTLEAIAEALAMLEGEEVGARLRAVHAALLEKQMSQRGYVGPHR
jgi:DTW domain-containing protein YfiP